MAGRCAAGTHGRMPKLFSSVAAPRLVEALDGPARPLSLHGHTVRNAEARKPAV